MLHEWRYWNFRKIRTHSRFKIIIFRHSLNDKIMPLWTNVSKIWQFQLHITTKSIPTFAIERRLALFPQFLIFPYNYANHQSTSYENFMHTSISILKGPIFFIWWFSPTWMGHPNTPNISAHTMNDSLNWTHYLKLWDEKANLDCVHFKTHCPQKCTYLNALSP